MTMNTTAPQVGQTVDVTLDPRRAARPGIVQSVDLDAGWVVVEVEVKGKAATLTKRVRIDRIELVDTPTAEEIAEAPEVDEACDAPAPVEDKGVEAALDGIAETYSEPVDAVVVADHTRDECEDLDACTDEHPESKRARRVVERPDGLVTPYRLVAILRERGLVAEDFTPQRMYGAVLSDKAYPGREVDGQRHLVDVEAGVQWWTARVERLAQRGQGRTRPARKTVQRGEVMVRLQRCLLAADVEAAVTEYLAELQG
jgi:hypothetical protein